MSDETLKHPDKTEQLSTAQQFALFKGGQDGVVVSLLTAMSLAAVFLSKVPPVILISWCLSMGVILAFRWYILHQFRNSTSPESYIAKASVYYKGTVIATSLGWCAAGFLFYTPDSQFHEYTMTVALVAISTGALSILSSHFKLVLVYTLITLSPLIINAFMIGGETMNMIGVVYVIYSLILIKQIYAGNQHTIAALKTEIDNKSLLIDFANAKKESDEAKDIAIEAAKSKAEFLANMSHEIRTPMNGVLGMTELLKDTPLTRTQREIAQTIHSSGKSLLSIINDILDYSKIDAKKLELHKTNFDLRDLIENVCVLFSENAQKKNIDLAYLYPLTSQTHFYGDRERVGQVLNNLISNAIKFTDEGEVILSVYIEEDTEINSTLRFEITDTGIGIGEQAQEKIFESFAQADGAITRQYGGTGLGLAICKQIVELMQGEIGILNSSSTGSTFYFSITLEKDLTYLATDHAEIDRDKLHDLRLLIISKHTVSRGFISEQLFSWGVDNDIAIDEMSAFALINSAIDDEYPYDLVITDHQPPELDGFGLSNTIKNDERLKDLPVVLFCPMSQTTTDAAISSFLYKPVRRNDLYETILQSVNRLEPAQSLQRSHSQAVPIAHQVLVVEDNPVNQKITRGLLEGLDCLVTMAQNGEQAYAVLSANPDRYDLVLMDYRMPKLNGVEATRLIRANPHIPDDLPIIALTASDNQEEKDRCLNSAMNDILVKPVCREILQQVIEKWTEDHSLSRTQEIDRTLPEELIHKNELDTIRSIQTAESPDLLIQCLENYFITSEKFVAEIENALKHSDTTMLIENVHNLRSSSISLGAYYLAELCGQIEEISKSGNTEIDQQALSTLKKCYQKTIQQMEEILEKEKASMAVV